MGLDNILTFGGSNKLDRELSEFRIIEDEYNSVADEYNLLRNAHSEILQSLSEERIEAERNFVLLTSLINTIKKSFREKGDDVSDELLSLVNVEKFNSTILSLESFKSNIISESYSNSLEFSKGSMDRLQSNFIDNGKVTKNEIKGELIALGAVAVIDSLSYISNLNSQVNNQRKSLVERRKVMQSNLELICSSYEEAYKELLRAKELTAVLNKNNQIFIKLYLRFLDNYFIDFNLKSFKTGSSKKELNENGFMPELRQLIKVSESYSNVKKTSITR